MIESDVAKLLKPAPRRHNKERSGDTSDSQFASDDGIAGIVVDGTGPESSEVNADGLRRSSWTRTVILFFFVTKTAHVQMFLGC